MEGETSGGTGSNLGGVGGDGSKMLTQKQSVSASNDLFGEGVFQIVEQSQNIQPASTRLQDDFGTERTGVFGKKGNRGARLEQGEQSRSDGKGRAGRGRPKAKATEGGTLDPADDECLDETISDRDESELPKDDSLHLTFDYVAKCWDAANPGDSDCKVISREKLALFIAKLLGNNGPKVFLGMADSEKFADLRDLIKAYKNDFWGKTTSKDLEQDPDYVEASTKFVEKNRTARKSETLFQQTATKCLLPYFSNQCYKPITAALLKRLYDCANDDKARVWGKFPKALQKLASPILENPEWQRGIRLPNACKDFGFEFGTIAIPDNLLKEIDVAVQPQLPDIITKPENDPKHCLEQLTLATEDLKSSSIRKTALGLELTVWKEREKAAKERQVKWKAHLERAIEIQKLGESLYEREKSGLPTAETVIDDLKKTANDDIVQATFKLFAMSKAKTGEDDAVGLSHDEEYQVCQKMMEYYHGKYGTHVHLPVPGPTLPISTPVLPAIMPVPANSTGKESTHGSSKDYDNAVASTSMAVARTSGNGAKAPSGKASEMTKQKSVMDSDSDSASDPDTSKHGHSRHRSTSRDRSKSQSRHDTDSSPPPTPGKTRSRDRSQESSERRVESRPRRRERSPSSHRSHSRDHRRGRSGSRRRHHKRDDYREGRYRSGSKSRHRRSRNRNDRDSSADSSKRRRASRKKNKSGRKTQESDSRREKSKSVSRSRSKSRSPSVSGSRRRGRRESDSSDDSHFSGKSAKSPETKKQKSKKTPTKEQSSQNEASKYPCIYRGINSYKTDLLSLQPKFKQGIRRESEQVEHNVGMRFANSEERQRYSDEVFARLRTVTKFGNVI